MYHLKEVFLLLSTFMLGNCFSRTHTYIENTGIEDLETSASGYSYQTKSGSPFNYKTYSSEGDVIPNEFEQPLDSIGRYYDQPVPLDQLPLSPNFVPQNVKSPDSYSEMLAPYAKGYEHFMNDNFGEPNHYGRQSTNFVKGGGSNYDDAVRASSGEKDTKGYSNREEFATGLKGQHQNDQRKGFYDILGGNKRGHQEEEGHYASNHQSAQSNKGESFSDEKSHDKGSKTTGFHKVYHKDEYKKNKSFYDTQDKKGHFNRYGNFQSKGEANAGAVAKGDSVDAGYRSGQFGAKGVSDKGKFNDEASGYKGSKGDAEHYNNEASYANKDAKSQNTQTGFRESAEEK